MKVYSSVWVSQSYQNDLKKEFPEVEFTFTKGIHTQELLDAEVFVTYGEDLTEEFILKTNQLKWIMVMSAGMDKMPFRACEEKGILVTNARGIHKIPMAEFAIGTMLLHEKQMKKLLENENNRLWERKLPMGELNGKTLLILGIGAIGGEIARLGHAFGMIVIGVNREGGAVKGVDEVLTLEDLNDVLHQADYIVSVLPSTEETKWLLDYDHFKKMKESAVFLNLGRGDLVKEEVLLEVLVDKQIKHAYLDVFVQEPLPEDHPFWRMENVTVTPHISSLTKEYLPRSLEIFKHNLHTYSNKKSDYINVIDLKRGY